MTKNPLTHKQFLSRVWNFSPEDFLTKFALVLEGELIQKSSIGLEDRTIFTLIIKNPTYQIPSEWIPSILDEGNHCLSEGSIFYEDDLAIITWSNYGHL